ncbi:MAG: hypothetical protein ACHQC8_02430 [Solirubrobacterales bacterium]
MSINWNQLAKDYVDGLPHPQAPDLGDGRRLTVKDYRVAVKLATAAKFGGHASPAEASAFWKEYEPLKDHGIGPEDFLHLLDVAAPTSYSLHGRPPTMNELKRFWDPQSHQIRPPAEIATYYETLPDKHYPTVPAGKMAKMIETARPYANQHIGRDPVKLEAAFFHHAGLGPSAIADHYKGMNPPEAQPPQLQGQDTGQEEGQNGQANQ